MPEIHAAIESLQRLTSAFGERRQQLAESVGLTEHQWGVLEEISTEHFMPSMFAKKRDSSPAAVSKTIRQLVDKGLVEVTLNKTDARQRDYQLTGQAKRVLGQLRRARARAIEQIWLKLDIEPPLLPGREDDLDSCGSVPDVACDDGVLARPKSGQGVVAGVVRRRSDRSPVDADMRGQQRLAGRCVRNISGDRCRLRGGLAEHRHRTAQNHSRQTARQQHHRSPSLASNPH